MIRLSVVGLSATLGLIFPAAALAQGAPVEPAPAPAGIPDPEVVAPTTDVVEPELAAAPAPGEAPDFEQTGSAWGFEVVSGVQLQRFGIDPTTGMPAVIPLNVPLIGVRKWASEGSGFEIGALFRIEKDAGQDANIFVGGAAGYLKTLSTHRHMRVFAEPIVGIGVLLNGEDGIDDSLALFARLAIGTEVRLGMIGLPQIGLTARIGAGLNVTSTGDATTITLGTEGGENTSVRSLLETSVGFVFYL